MLKWCHRTLIYDLKGFISLQKSSSPNPNPNPLFQNYPSQTFSLNFSTNTSDSTSYAVSYLIHNFGFSPQFASKLCSTYKVNFKTAQNPDSVLNFFRNHGFSDSQLRHIIAKVPGLLSCDPSKRVLPKFQFFLSKGASTSDIVNLLSKNPRVLSVSLMNRIVPIYELVYRFLQSHKDTIACATHSPILLCDNRVQHNITLLVENGVADSNIIRLLQSRIQSLTIHTCDIAKLVEELKDLGFHPSKSTFGVALIAKLSITKTLWKQKVDAFKKWGWSDEDVVKAFTKQPYCMLTSIDKINLVMSFWVNQLGWDALALANGPSVFLLSLGKRIIPRAQVLQFLLNNGLRKKDASLTCPFIISDKLFIETFIKRFEKESSSLLKLYEENLNLSYTTDKNCT